jgi:hypothetical protein
MYKSKAGDDDMVKALVAVKKAWKKACEYDKIASGSKFVVFSASNPYAVKYNEAMERFLNAKRLIHGG